MKQYSFQSISAEKIPINMSLYSHDEEKHTHDYIELIYILSGSGIHYVDDVAYFTRRGSLLYVDFGQTHSYTVLDNMSYVNFRLRPEYFVENATSGMKDILSMQCFTKNCSSIQMAQFEGHACAIAENLVFGMVEEDLGRADGYETIIKNNVVNLLIFMQRNLVSESFNPCIVKIPDQLRAAVEYIDCRCCDKLTLKEVSSISNYSEGYLSRLIKQYFGCSFSEYVLKKRINQAMYYLMMTDLSIQQIYDKTGFTNRTLFYKTFKKLIGVQPSFIKNYRMNYKNYVRSAIEKQKNEF